VPLETGTAETTDILMTKKMEGGQQKAMGDLGNLGLI
jgi:hypothetical protein